MPTYIKDLIELPDQVRRGDFVLRLTEGVTKPEETLDTYVVTPQLVRCFDDALGMIRAGIEGRTSKAAYLHGSFGSGKTPGFRARNSFSSRTTCSVPRPWNRTYWAST